MSTDRLAVASVLERIAEFLEYKGENPFRVRAFQAAAKVIMALPGGVEEALADGSLAATKGIGPATLAIVHELLTTGSSRYLEELRREVPPGLLEMAEIPGLGFKRVRTIHQKLGIDSLEQLEDAARDGRLAKLPGLGAKTAEKVLRGIAFVRGARTLSLWHEAAREAEVLRAALAELEGVERVVVAGDVRRRAEVAGELVLVVDVGDQSPGGFSGGLADLSGVAITNVNPGGSEVGFRTAGGTPGRLLVVRAISFGSALVRGTGNPEHLALLEAKARERSLSFDGVTLRRGNEPVACGGEAELYQALGLAGIPPELREGLDEVELAERNALPRLIERSDLAGLLHCHSTWSDGKQGIAELATAARQAGYAWLGLTDHSQSAAYAGGLGPEEVRRQWDEIAHLTGVPDSARLLRGIESDILGDGRLDYDGELLAGFEFVIGSVHSRMGMEAAEMTDRLLAALEHPALTLMGHPTGRLLLAREPFKFDLDRVFARAAELGVGFEINGDPHRLDLDWRLVRRARALGVSISIGADAHGVDSIVYQENALAMARKAGLTREDVLNTRTAEGFLEFARARRT